MEEIIITGYGIKAPGALTKSQFRKILQEGTCTQTVLQNVNRQQDSIAAGVIQEDFSVINGKRYRRYPRAVRMAISAALDAAEMARLKYYEPHRIAVIIGTSAGAVLEIEQNAANGFDYQSYPLHGVSLVDTHTFSASVASALHINGLAFTLTTGCTASIDAVLFAQLLLQTGTVDACVVGGTDAPLGQWTVNGFKKLKALITNTAPEETGVPFSDKHGGFVLAEGAGVIILERRQSAEQREQPVYGTIRRVVSRNEGQPLLRSDTSGSHMLQVFQETVGNDIPTYINSQALGLETNDAIERNILLQTFNGDVPVTSIKGMIGHTFGAMGAMQIIASLISMEYGFIPPTIKTKGHGFEDIPIVYETRYQPVESICITTHGYSGNNACLFMTKT
nr:beta-ketoacyl synthase N-terminal-like domain-containing protein [uncultured Bacillus sp.]